MGLKLKMHGTFIVIATLISLVRIFTSYATTFESTFKLTNDFCFEVTSSQLYFRTYLRQKYRTQQRRLQQAGSTFNFQQFCNYQHLFPLDVVIQLMFLIFNFSFQLSICTKLVNRYCQPIANASALCAALTTQSCQLFLLILVVLADSAAIIVQTAKRQYYVSFASAGFALVGHNKVCSQQKAWQKTGRRNYHQLLFLYLALVLA